jgi:hypothetical protein
MFVFQKQKYRKSNSTERETVQFRVILRYFPDIRISKEDQFFGVVRTVHPSQSTIGKASTYQKNVERGREVATIPVGGGFKIQKQPKKEVLLIYFVP